MSIFIFSRSVNQRDLVKRLKVIIIGRQTPAIERAAIVKVSSNLVLY